MLQEEIFEMLSRIVSGEAEVDDILKLNDWLNQDEKNGHRLKQLKRYWDLPVAVKNLDPNKAFATFGKRVDAPAGKQKPARSLHYWFAAATAALLIVAATLFFNNSHSVEYYTYNCINGVEQILLPDSTLIYLNKGSKITYTNNYAVDRKVDLTGEAYFDVRKSPSGMFTVHVGYNTAIEVLGTKFNVQAFEGRQQLVTTLEEGSIRFVKGGQVIPLAPGQQLTYHFDKAGYHIKEVEADLYSAWKDYIYRYNGITMQELCKALENSYRVEIGLSPRLQDIKVSGSFNYKNSIEQILDIMKKRMQFEWNRNDKIITIK